MSTDQAPAAGQGARHNCPYCVCDAARGSVRVAQMGESVAFAVATDDDVAKWTMTPDEARIAARVLVEVANEAERPRT